MQLSLTTAIAVSFTLVVPARLEGRSAPLPPPLPHTLERGDEQDGSPPPRG